MFRTNNLRRAMVGGNLPRLFGALVGLVLAAGLLATTNSYFAGSADTGVDSWATGAVTITEDVPGAALFSVTDIAPGWSDSKTVTVTNASSIEDPDGLEVRLYAQNLTGDADLADALDVTVEYAGTTEIYSGKLDDLVGNWADFANGGGHTGWVSAGGAAADPTATYEITVEFPDTGVDQSTLESKTAGVTFVWEARSTGVDAP